MTAHTEHLFATLLIGAGVFTILGVLAYVWLEARLER